MAGKRAGILGVALAAAASVGAMGVTATAASAVPGGGNLECPAGTTTLKLDRAPVLGEVITDGTLTVTITLVQEKTDGSGELYGFDFTSEGGTVTNVIVKGGPTAFMYRADRVEPFHTLLGPGGRHYGISNLKFCYV